MHQQESNTKEDKKANSDSNKEVRELRISGQKNQRITLVITIPPINKQVITMITIDLSKVSSFFRIKLKPMHHRITLINLKDNIQLIYQ